MCRAYRAKFRSEESITGKLVRYLNAVGKTDFLRALLFCDECPEDFAEGASTVDEWIYSYFAAHASDCEEVFKKIFFKYEHLSTIAPARPRIALTRHALLDNNLYHRAKWHYNRLARHTSLPLLPPFLHSLFVTVLLAAPSIAVVSHRLHSAPLERRHSRISTRQARHKRFEWSHTIP